MTELLPCPFCGGKAKVMRLDLDSIDEGWKLWGVWCEDDMNEEYEHGHYIENYATEGEAVAAWNLRAEQAVREDRTPVPNRLVQVPKTLLEIASGIAETNAKYWPNIQEERLRSAVSIAYRSGYTDGYRDGHTDAENGHDERVIARVN